MLGKLIIYPQSWSDGHFWTLQPAVIAGGQIARARNIILTIARARIISL